MFTMSAREIKRALRRNAREGVWPSSLAQIAARRGNSRTVMTMALKQPRRYRDARLFIEQALRGDVVAPASKAS